MIQKDKIYHLVAGAIIAIVIYWIAKQFGFSEVNSLRIGLSASVIVGLLKELLDVNKTGFNKIDLLATILGGFLALTILKLI